jgi:hypothetical protein
VTDTRHTADDAQAARWARREQLAVLLSRMQRGVLLPEERGLLRTAVETELADAERAHARLAVYEQQHDNAVAAALATVAEAARRAMASTRDDYALAPPPAEETEQPGDEPVYQLTEGDQP